MIVVELKGLNRVLKDCSINDLAEFFKRKLNMDND